jgi:hypothetical protein
MSQGEDIKARREVAEELLGGHRLAEAWGGYAPCPGAGMHNGKTGPKDFKVLLEGAPTGHCLHKSCADEVAAWNYQFRRKVWEVEHGGARSNGTPGRPGKGVDMRNVASLPKEEAAKRTRTLDREAVEKVVRGVPAITRHWLWQRSPVDVRACGLEGFFSALYQEGERVLIFTKFTSQGDFAWWQGKGSYRLGRREGQQAVKSELPTGGPCGVWFLANPADLKWHPVKHISEGGRKLSRRSEPGITAWRYMVLESDDLEEELWLRVLVNLRLPIAAVYTSGGRSIHALIRGGWSTKAEWDQYRNELGPLLTSLGADGAALTAVRLTRLPFMLRRGSEKKDGTYVEWGQPAKQELLWLDPKPDFRGMIHKGVQR